jgi:hypothetical protein
MGSGGIAPPFLTSALAAGEWSDSRTGRFTPWYPLDGRLGGPQNRSGLCGEETNLLPLPGIKLSRPASSTSLYRLSYRNLSLETECSELSAFVISPVPAVKHWGRTLKWATTACVHTLPKFIIHNHPAIRSYVHKLYTECI